MVVFLYLFAFSVSETHARVTYDQLLKNINLSEGQVYVVLHHYTSNFSLQSYSIFNFTIISYPYTIVVVPYPVPAGLGTVVGAPHSEYVR